MSWDGSATGRPSEGLSTLFDEIISNRDSSWLSNESGTCTAIWSPSKSALNAAHTSGWMRIALHVPLSFRSDHQQPRLELALERERHVHGHLVAVEVGVERRAHERVDADRLARAALVPIGSSATATRAGSRTRAARARPSGRRRSRR